MLISDRADFRARNVTRDKRWYESESESRSVMSDSLWPHGLYRPWNSPGQDTVVGSLSLLQGIFPTEGSNPGLLHCRQILYQLSHKGSPRILEWVAYPFFRGSSWPKNPTGVSCIAGGFFYQLRYEGSLRCVQHDGKVVATPRRHNNPYHLCTYMRVSKCEAKKLTTELQGKINESAITVEYFNTYLLEMDISKGRKSVRTQLNHIALSMNWT